MNDKEKLEQIKESLPEDIDTIHYDIDFVNLVKTIRTVINEEEDLHRAGLQ